MTVFKLAGPGGGALIGVMGSRSVCLHDPSSEPGSERNLAVRSLGEVVIFAKALDCPWDAVRALLLKLSNRTVTDMELAELCSTYSHLSRATALGTLEYYRFRQPA